MRIETHRLLAVVEVRLLSVRIVVNHVVPAKAVGRLMELRLRHRVAAVCIVQRLDVQDGLLRLSRVLMMLHLMHQVAAGSTKDELMLGVELAVWGLGALDRLLALVNQRLLAWDVLHLDHLVLVFLKTKGIRSTRVELTLHELLLSAQIHGLRHLLTVLSVLKLELMLLELLLESRRFNDVCMLKHHSLQAAHL